MKIMSKSQIVKDNAVQQVKGNTENRLFTIEECSYEASYMLC